jgi:hypothetical protein
MPVRLPANDALVDEAAGVGREKTAGVPPRGFEPLISTLKGSCPRPLDDGGAARTGVYQGEGEGLAASPSDRAETPGACR